MNRLNVARVYLGEACRHQWQVFRYIGKSAYIVAGFTPKILQPTPESDAELLRGLELVAQIIKGNSEPSK